MGCVRPKLMASNVSLPTSMQVRQSYTTHKRLFSHPWHRSFSIHHTLYHPSPNPDLALNSSTRDLLRNAANMSLKTSVKQRTPSHTVNTFSKPLRELENYPSESTIEINEEEREGAHSKRPERKSPAAVYGSKSIGTVALPDELQLAITDLVQNADKTFLQLDAKRLFAHDASDETSSNSLEWTHEFDPSHKSRSERLAHGERDGTAFATVALPAQYTALTAVFDLLKHRMSNHYRVRKVFEWGAATGAGMWASLHAFQNQTVGEDDARERKIADSSLETYTSIEKREGLVAIGKRLIANTGHLNTSLTWQKSWHVSDTLPVAASSSSSLLSNMDTIALSAFNLASLPSNIARRTIVKQMWESGAGTIVIIDHATIEGFQAVAEARAYLLRVGKYESQSQSQSESQPESQMEPNVNGRGWSGSHVVAPCPHDGACPLFNPSKRSLICAYEQRFQRPAFLRLTKKTKIGHEDVGYTYVIVQRGQRVTMSEGDVERGRVGAVGREEAEKIASGKMRELALHHDEQHNPVPACEDTTVSDLQEADSSSALVEHLRLTSPTWPRLIFPPIKRSGHIILDACTSAARIERLIIPKSQGKQAYYDARKAKWGDSWVHPAKNGAQVRKDINALEKSNNGNANGKSKRGRRERTKTSTEDVIEEVQAEKKRVKKSRKAEYRASERM